MDETHMVPGDFMSTPVGVRIDKQLQTVVTSGPSITTSALENYINRTVAVITSDGRMMVGTLKGFDQTINLILDESLERVFSSSQGVEQVVLGLYTVRGDNVAVIGEIDEETDSALDLGNIRAEPLNSVAH
ncbi:hypothetical protein U0070_022174 [Myodes glareolus]|uniref:U6 snRNA-associated Sm-like protein LSm8 n=1 Tax=Myodes glareolus TaxID=447135 RepID=A0AAW0IP06_MYOGA